MGFDGWMLIRLAIPIIAVVIDQKSRYDSRCSQDGPCPGQDRARDVATAPARIFRIPRVSLILSGESVQKVKGRLKECESRFRIHKRLDSEQI